MIKSMKSLGYNKSAASPTLDFCITETEKFWRFLCALKLLSYEY
ncbi:hypothetical protein WCLE_008240 [Wolbachia endosymbiont of Cimex lectularius]|nr:hypothetical protein WCLE_008240 [Wolbachia endosymbiont of Cimex lectularius]